MFSQGWNRRCKITIDNTKVAADETNFPVLLTQANLPSEMFDADGDYPAKNGGADIRFSSDADGETELCFEIVNFVIDNDPANGTAEIHVKIQNLSGSVDTEIYVWYKNSAASAYGEGDTYGKHNVWDSNFKMVHHMSDETTSTILDSTSNSKDGTKKAANEPIETTGTIGKAQSYDGSDDYIDTTLAGNLTSNATFEAIINLNAIDATQSILNCEVGGQKWPSYVLIVLNTNKAAFTFFKNSSTKQTVESITQLSTGTSYHLVGTYDGSNLRIYINGSEDNIASASGTPNNISNNYLIGGAEYNSSPYYRDPPNGYLDEVRVSNVVRDANWISTQYQNQNSPSTFASASSPVGETFIAWYNTSWKYRKKFEIQASKVAGNETNFPIYLNLSDFGSDFFANAKDGGGDIRITKSDGITELAREIKSCDQSGNTGEVHFKTDSVSSSINTEFYIYYGNASASDYAEGATYGKHNVWDSNYKMVHHMTGATYTALDDSTSNNNDVMVEAGNPTYNQTGKMNEAVDFDGSSDNISVADSATTKLETDDGTISLWVKMDTVAGAYKGILAKRTNSNYTGWSIYKSTDDKIYSQWASAHGGPYYTAGANDAAVQGNWYHITVTADGTTLKMYVNGVVQTATDDISAMGDVSNTTPLLFGDEIGITEMHGLLDEVRLSKGIARSASWISTEYNNQNSPSTFYTVCEQEANWYDNDWSYRTKVSVQNAKAPGASSDFPVYIDLSKLDSNFWANVKNGGGDIRITSDDGETELAREIVNCNSATNTGVVHFKASSLSASLDTIFYVYYGNADANDYAVSDTYGAQNVWTNNFQGVRS